MDYKQRIIEEAAGMFRTYGIRAVTMDMLAAQMGISKRNIYEVTLPVYVYSTMRCRKSGCRMWLLK